MIYFFAPFFGCATFATTSGCASSAEPIRLLGCGDEGAVDAEDVGGIFFWASRVACSLASARALRRA